MDANLMQSAARRVRCSDEELVPNPSVYTQAGWRHYQFATDTLDTKVKTSLYQATQIIPPVVVSPAIDALIPDGDTRLHHLTRGVEFDIAGGILEGEHSQDVIYWSFASH
jgi:hypothetical protein